MQTSGLIVSELNKFDSLKNLEKDIAAVIIAHNQKWKKAIKEISKTKKLTKRNMEEINLAIKKGIEGMRNAVENSLSVEKIIHKSSK